MQGVFARSFSSIRTEAKGESEDVTKQELLAKCDEALAACLERTKKKAEGDEALNARNMAKAARTLCLVRYEIERRDVEE